MNITTTTKYRKYSRARKSSNILQPSIIQNLSTRRETKPMNTYPEASIRRSGDGPEIIISPDPPVGELGRSCERGRRTTEFPCSCLNAQMIGEIVAASRRLASLPPVGRFVAPTMARCKTEQWTLTPSKML